MRSRYQQNMEEERATLFHQSKEMNKNQKQKLTKMKLRNPDGSFDNNRTTEDAEEIAEECWGFFDALLNARHDHELKDTGQPFVPNYKYLNEFLTGLPELSEASQAILEAPLKKEEVEEALKKCKSGKSPGLDGLSYEFYSSTWQVIGYYQALRAELTSYQLAESDKHGVTRLLVKVPDTPSVLDLRPVTLLNCSYKLLSMVLVRRLSGVLPEVITSGQLAVPGRSIMSGGHNLVSTINFINKDPRRGGFVASWDQLKAHDRASTVYTDLVLEAMKFPLKFRDWIKMLHREATTCLLTGPEGLSREITVLCSFRQGDPLATPLYSLQQEPFLRRVRACVQWCQDRPQCLILPSGR